MNRENQQPSYDSLPDGMAPAPAELEAMFSGDQAFNGTMKRLELLQRLEGQCDALHHRHTKGGGLTPEEFGEYQRLSQIIGIVQEQASETPENTRTDKHTRRARAFTAVLRYFRFNQ